MPLYQEDPPHVGKGARLMARRLFSRDSWPGRAAFDVSYYRPKELRSPMPRTRGRYWGLVVLLTCAGLVASTIALFVVYPLTRPASAESSSPNPVYTVTDLGTLGGSTSIARDINDCGQVVGQSLNASGQNRGFLWEEGKGMKDLGTLGGPTSPARGINDPANCSNTGQIVGFSRISTSNNQLRAYLVQSGQMTDLGTLTDLSNSGTLITFPNSEAWSINDSGVAVGRAFTSATEGRAVLWENGKIKNIGKDLKTPYSEAWSINNDGQVVGEAGVADQQARAFLYDNNTNQVTNIDAAGRDPANPVFPYQYSEAAAINDRGQVVGWSYRPTTNVPPSTPAGPEGEAFLYEKGQDGTTNVVNLDPLQGDPLDPTDDDLYSRARDIDSTGRAVGWSRGTDGNERLQFSAVLWRDGKVMDLNKLIPANSRWRLTEDGTIKGWTLTDAYAINASGQIVGAGFKDGKDENLSQLRAFLLTPDTTAPKIECGAADGLWHREDVSIPCTATDDGVGLANPEAASFTLSTDVSDGTETADAETGSREVCDAAGNCATAGPIGGNKVDRKAPVITIGTTPGGNEYELGDDVVVDYDCLDGGSGTASCSGPVASGGKLDTASVGQHSFAVKASDEAGNVGSGSIDYRVLYDFGGFFRPVDNPEVLNKANAGSTIPVKFGLDGEQGLDIFEQGYPRSVPIACDPNDQVDAIEQTLNDGSSHLEYDATTDQYTYVWKTDRAWAHTCRQLVVRLDDGSTHLANFKFAR
jgi:probable HAF family extracellular repeat protein